MKLTGYCWWNNECMAMYMYTARKRDAEICIRLIGCGAFDISD